MLDLGLYKPAEVVRNFLRQIYYLSENGFCDHGDSRMMSFDLVPGKQSLDRFCKGNRVFDVSIGQRTIGNGSIRNFEQSDLTIFLGN